MSLFGRDLRILNSTLYLIVLYLYFNFVFKTSTAVVSYRRRIDASARRRVDENYRRRRREILAKKPRRRRR